jgi:hypothetical protein
MRLFLFFLLCLTGAAHAQFAVNVSLPRTNFLVLEAIPATVTLTNRSGSEVVLGGPGRASWLSFQMTDSQGHELAPLDVDASDMVQIPPGGTIQRKIVVTDAYAPTELGNYGLMARVRHTPTGQYYGSNRVRFNITDAKPLWEQSFGVPEGFRGAGSARRYGILLFIDIGSTSLYFRMTDERSGIRLQTYRLGPVSMAHDPQITIDSQNQLQVLFLAQPNVYAHCVVRPDGSLKSRMYYRDESGNRPRLVQEASGETRVEGGVAYDPAAAPASQPARKASERPPGL